MANATKARDRLGWEPKIGFAELVRIMVDADLEALGLTSPGAGREVVREKFSAWHRWEAGTALARETAATGV
jgi:GDPmannose 4,6-dehydratase